MKHLRCIFLLQFVTILAFAQSAHRSKPSGLPNHPEAVVRSLYTEVVARHPLGVPGGAAFQVFKPYLSKTLLERIDTNVACQDDWGRKHPDRDSKPPFLEFGLLSGDDLRAEPSSFQIEKMESEKGGSVRAYVRLTHDEPGGTPWSWHVAVILVQEAGHFVVNDVIFLKDSPQDSDGRLSEYLSQGCDGSRWVGSHAP
jgi:hypothetical protein